MYRHLQLVVLSNIFILVYFNNTLVAQTRVDVGKSYFNISKQITGGTFKPSDTIEVRVTIAVNTVATSTILDSVIVNDSVPLKTKYIIGSLRIRTNEGINYKGPFTEAVDADQGSSVGGAITVKLKRIRSDSSRPSFYSSNCIMMACYWIQVDPASSIYGDTIKTIPSTIKYKYLSPALGWRTTTFPTYKILLFQYNGFCSNGLNISSSSDSSGTFGSGTVQNRLAPLAFTTTYTKQNMSTGQPNDYNYAIVNNSSADGSTNPNSIMPEAPALHRVFGLWDICGDHTNAANLNIGNPPTAPGIAGGYMVLVNASYNTDVAYQEILNNLCPNTIYEFSAWFRNICPRCSCDSAGRGSGSVGFIPGPGNDSSGVKPNLAFEMDNLLYYTTGDIKYNRASPWKKYGFTFTTGIGQTSAQFVIRNNSPGGGGNDWAMDDISVSACVPNLKMNFYPIVLGCKEAPFLVSLSDTVSFAYNNSYVYYKWQKKLVSSNTWNDVPGSAGGPATTTFVNGQWQYVTNLTPFLTTPTDSGDMYRVVVATSPGNLSSINCSFTDGNSTTIKLIKCAGIVGVQVVSFGGLAWNNKTILRWHTNHEYNVKEYIIQRSTDGIDFKDIGAVAATNNPENAYYSFDDPDIIHNTFYYRLRIRAMDGMFEYSRIIITTITSYFEVKGIKNPFSDNKINAEVILPEDGIIKCKLFDSNGRMVVFNSLQLNKGYNVISISCGSIASGFYSFSIEYNDKEVKRRLMKIN